MKEFYFEGNPYIVHKSGVVVSKNGKELSHVDNGKGYFRVTLCGNGKSKKVYVHRLVWECFKGPIPEDREIDHKNDNRAHNFLDNLSLVTRKQNMKKMLARNPKVLQNLKNFKENTL